MNHKKNDSHADPLPGNRNSRRLAAAGWIAGLLVLLIARTIYGLWGEFWFPDELQIFLIGLKYFTTGQWPFFGPDVVYTQSQIPGALQGLLVGLPLYASKLPEAPTVFLNAMTFCSLLLFAWYLCKRFTDIPRWIIVLWVMTCPWSMVYGTIVVNPSYVLPFAILFFIGIFETYAFFRTAVIPLSLGFFMMGVSTTAVMQLHMSWVLMIPMAAAAFGIQAKKGIRPAAKSGMYYIAGCALGVATLAPTILAFGANGSGGAERAVVFNLSNIKEIAGVPVRFLAFAAYEIPYLLGPGTESRLAVIKAHPWMAPSVIILLLTGFLQVFFFIVSFFLKNRADEWNRVRWFTLGVVFLTYLSFLFSVKGPSSHTFYLLFPLAMFYSMCCYRRLFRKRRLWSIVSAVLLGVSFFFYLGLGLNNLKVRSLYRDRPLVVKAIEKKDYTILGKRRTDEWGYGY